MKNTTCPLPLYRLSFWPLYLVQMRPYLLFVSGAAGLAGIAVASDPDLPAWRSWLAFLPLFLGYGFGQALTDCFQTDTDKISAPNRPLSKGQLVKNHVMAVSLGGLVSGVGLLVWLNPWNIIPGVMTVIGLVTYTFFKRHYWWGGPPYNALIMSMLPLMGFLAVKGTEMTCAWPEILPVMLLTFISYTNFVLIGYLKDITADRATGYQTFPVRFGWLATVRIGHVVLALSIMTAYWILQASWPVLWLLTVASFIGLAGQIYAERTKDRVETNAGFPVACTVRAFIGWHIALILAFQPEWWPWLVLFYLSFEGILYQRPEPHQV